MTCVDKVNNFSFFSTSSFYIPYGPLSSQNDTLLYIQYTHNAVSMLFEMLFNISRLTYQYTIHHQIIWNHFCRYRLHLCQYDLAVMDWNPIYLLFKSCIKNIFRCCSFLRTYNTTYIFGSTQYSKNWKKWCNEKMMIHSNAKSTFRRRCFIIRKFFNTHWFYPLRQT